MLLTNCDVLGPCLVLQMAEQEQYQQLGGYSDEQGQHYAALYAAQAQMGLNAAQMGIAQMSQYDQAAHLAAWQVHISLPEEADHAVWWH